MRRQQPINQRKFLRPATPKNVASTRVTVCGLPKASTNAEMMRKNLRGLGALLDETLALELESAQALLVAAEDMENAGSGRATTPEVNIVTPKKRLQLK